MLAVVVTVVGIAPWVRNHGFLRDFYDYGLFINASARIEAGQRPFVDFATPAQSAALLLNHVVERLGGGTYIGMTWGAAALIAVAAVGLLLLLGRRWPWPLAAVLTAAIVACSASQHTILFYNPIGVFAMALVVWSFAIAPLLRREHLAWHVIAAVGLVLGGINKLNFHLLSCAMALGWIVWGAWQARASWRRIAASIAFVGLFGAAVPLGLELAWTGADLRTWHHNVIELALGARGGRVGLLTNAKLYFDTLHDYYGPLRLPHSGLVVIALPLLAMPAAWFAAQGERSWQRGIFASVAALCGAASGAALLLTNNEIVYLTVAASLVILAGLWLGFRLPVRGAWAWLALGGPALIVGACGWESAWLGQRSQFGHETAPRTSYVGGASLGAEFRYLRGLAIPPAMAVSLEKFSVQRAALGAEASRMFYGPGVEWLQRIWPSTTLRGLPLVAAAFESERELEQVRREVIEGRTFRHLVVVEAWDSWHPSLHELMRRRFSIERVGRFFVYHPLPEGVLGSRPLEFHESIGGNVESTRLRSTLPLQQLPDGRRFVGTDHGSGQLRIEAPSYRISGEAVLRRFGQQAAVVPVRFEAHAVNGAARYLRWSRDLALAEGEEELVIPTGQLDASGNPLEFSVTVPPEAAGAVLAGWREPRLWNTVESERTPPRIQPRTVAAEHSSAELRAALLPAGLQGAEVWTREARLHDGMCWLPPGGELWIRLPGILSRIEVVAEATDSEAGTAPRLRVVYYKGGRLEFFNPVFEPAANRATYPAWSCESDGWLAILADPHRANAPFRVSIGNVERPAQ